MSGYRRTFRVLITGSRSWEHPERVEEALDVIFLETRGTGRRLIVRHGCCPKGPDSTASLWVKKRMNDHLRDGPVVLVGEDPWPARWSNGRQAGIERNQEMVDAGADVCLAFIRDKSRGASHCSGRAQEAGIPTIRWLHNGLWISEPDPGWAGGLVA